MAIINDTYCVYIHTTPSNKAYVGITCQKPDHRWNGGRGYKQHRYFNQAIKKYGWDNIKHTIFVDGLTKQEACHVEQLLIALFNTTNRQYGYNISYGGETGTRGIKLSETTRNKIAKANMGRSKTPYEIEKIRNAHLGKTLSDDTKRKLHNCNIGKHLSEDTKRKIGESLKGKTYSNASPVFCVELNKVFPSSTIAASYVGHNGCGGNILKACKGQVKTAYTYHWKYANEQEIG